MSETNTIKVTTGKELYNYQGKFLGNELDKWQLKLYFIEFIGYKTPEQLSLLKIEKNSRASFFDNFLFFVWQ